MAHQLLDDTMFYVGETPWHKLGVPLDNPPTIEEAVILANLDWEVYKKPTYYFTGAEPRQSNNPYSLANFANLLYTKDMVETKHYVTIRDTFKGDDKRTTTYDGHKILGMYLKGTKCYKIEMLSRLLMYYLTMVMNLKQLVL